jgi:hypothetical protein
MQYKKCWSENDVKLYFTTESREKNKEAFERTHLPIKKVYVDFSRDLPQGTTFITEEELKKLVISSSLEDYNRIFLIVGETGCGKSELCQWLEYNINDGLHVPVHISRSDTKMEDIARILNSHLPEELQEPIGSSELVNIPAGLIADFLVAKLRIELAQDKTIKDLDKKILEKLFNHEVFKGKLASDVAEYQQAVSTTGKERRLLILSKKAFDFFPSVKNLSDAEETYRFVNKVITNTLKEYLKVSDVSEKLRLISEYYVKLGKRPVLLLEDLTSFSFLAEDLIDYLFDLAKGHFDVVIGWTTGFETGYRDYIFKAPDALTYMKERIRARLVLTDQNRSTFFMKDSYKDLARKYLSAIKCGRCEICQTDKESLYPFNSSCLDRVYDNMQEEGNPKQTPRIFLEFVLRRVLQSSEPPWKTFSQIPHLKLAPSLIGQTFQEFKDFVDLVRWYGKDLEENVEIDTAVVKWFDVSAPSAPGGQPYIIPKSRIALLMRKVSVGTKQEMPQIQLSESDLVNFEQWVATGGKFLDRDSLRNGVIKALQTLGDPCEIRNLNSTVPRTVSLFYQRGTDAIPTFIEDSGDDTSDIDYKVHVSRKSPTEVLEQLYLLGRGGNLSEQTLVATLEWANENALQYNKKLKDNLSEAMGISIEGFVLISKFLLTNLISGCVNLDANELKKDLGQERSSIPSFQDEYLNEKTQALVQKGSDIQGLFSSFFMLTSTFFDYLLFQRVCSEIDLSKTLNVISKIDARKIRDAYKVGNKKDNTTFRELIMAIRNYASTLSRFSYAEVFSRMKSELITIQTLIPKGATLKDVQNRIDKVKEACGVLEIPLEQSWLQAFQELSNQDINLKALQKEIDMILSDFSKCTDVYHFIAFNHKFLNAQSKREYKIVSILGQIVLALQRKADTLIKSLEETASPLPDTERVKKAYAQLSKLAEEFK